MTGLPGKPDLGTLEARVVHTAFDQAGEFECSNELFNRIQRNTLWSYISNFVGYPTDCPHREKNGWTGDAHLAAETGLFNFDAASAYAKWLNDLKDEQRPTGELPGIVPTSGWGYQWGNGPAWDSAYVLIPWYLYQYCGDTRILAEHYDRLKLYVDYLTSKAKGHIVAIGLGDWAPAKTTTPEKVTSTGYYYVDALIVSKAAALLGKTEDAKKYADLAAAIRDAFNQEFYDPQDGSLCRRHADRDELRAVPRSRPGPGATTKSWPSWWRAIQAKDGHLDAGILGTKYLIDASDRRRPGRCRLRHGHQDRLPELGPLARTGRDHALGAVGRQRLAQSHHVRPHQRLVLSGRWPASIRTPRRWASSISSSSRSFSAM